MAFLAAFGSVLAVPPSIDPEFESPPEIDPESDSPFAFPPSIDPESDSCPTLPSFMVKDENRVIGGETAESPIPWQVSIQKPYIGGAWCGGTILDSTTILTAAHCLDTKGTDYTKWYVMAGKVSKYSEDRIKIAQVILHPNYDDPSNRNDIAIVKLSEPLEFNESIQPMCLPSKEFEPKEGDLCYASGWGGIQYGRKYSFLYIYTIFVFSNEFYILNVLST